MAVTTTTVKRNDVDAVFNLSEVKRGEHAGWKFLELPVTEDNLLSVIIPWAGVKQVTQIIKGALRQKAMTWSEQAEAEAKDEKTGVTDDAVYLQAFDKLASSFSARGEKISTIMAQIMELVSEMGDLDFTNPEQMKRGAEIAAEVKSLQLDIQLKKRKTDEDKAAEAAHEAANAAA